MSYHSAYKGSQLDAAVAAITALQQQKWNAVPNVLTATASLNFDTIFTGASTALPVTVTGARANDVVLIGLPAGDLGRVWVQGYVATNDTVQVKLTNESGGSAVINTITVKVVVLKF